MSRSLTEIYTSAKEARDQHLELTEFKNTSKMSILDAFTWTTSACIWVFENILDVFQVDMAKELQNRINGTPAYYANALLKYQSGDELEMNGDGTSFSYSNVDETKRIISKVSYSEYSVDGFHDKLLLLKVASGEPGNYQRLDSDELLAVRAYLDKIKFAGTNTNVVSRKGDILIPRVTVYYDGAVSANEMYNNMEQSLNEFIANVDFNGVVYVQRVIDAIQKTDHVLDVYIDNNRTDLQGVFVAQYNDDDLLIQTNKDGDPINYEKKVDRMFTPNSGFIKQSSRAGDEELFQTWRESIVLLVEEK